MKYLLTVIFALSFFLGVSYAQDKKLVQFSGIIYNSDSVSLVVPYVSITNLSQKNAFFPANYQGYFSFVAHEQDTIVFSAVGYRREMLVIPSGLNDMKYTVKVKMKPEIINLPTVHIYPWATVDEFTRAFLTMKVADDNLLIAKKNMSRESILALGRSLPRDAQDMNIQDFQNMHFNLSNKNMNMKGANPLMNPFAWASFIQQITQGDKSRSGN